VSSRSFILVGAGSKLGAEVAGRLLQFAVAYYAQVTLGPADYGYLVYATAAGLVMAPLADGGLQLNVTREMAAQVSAAAQVARAGLRVKLRLAFVAMAVLAGVAVMRPAGTQLATWATAAAMVAATFVEYAGYVLRGLQRVTDDARLTLILRVVTAAAGALTLWFGGELTAFAVSMLVSTGGVALAAFLWLARELPHDARAPVHLSDRRLLARAWPLGAAVFLSMLYTRTPTFMLDAWMHATAVGVFGVAQRLIEPFSVLPASAMAAVFPIMARDNHVDPARTRRLRDQTSRWLLALGVLVALGGVIIGPAVIRLLYRGQYAGAERPLQILAVTTVLTFTNYALTHFLVAIDRQRTLLRMNLVVFATNVVAGSVLIPRFGPTGAALAILVSEGILLTACLNVLRRASRVRTAAEATTTGRPMTLDN
jgi:O-antigen/teichoic acid export membrane protein